MKTTVDDQKDKEWYDDRPGHRGEHDSLGVHPERAEAEAADLEAAYNTPSAPEPSRPTLSPSSISASEGSVSSPVSTSAEQSEQDGLSRASLFTGESSSSGKGVLARLSGRQKGIAVTTVVVLFGGGTAFFSLANGPLQFIHLAQLLQQFHFSDNEDMGDGRLLKLYKWSKFASSDTPLANTRLSLAGRRVADRIDPRMAEIGVTKKYADTFGAVYQGTEIDIKKFAENAKNGEQFKPYANNSGEFATKFKEVYGIDVTVSGEGKVISSGENGVFNYFRNRRLNVSLVDEAQFSKISASVSARVMGKRDAVIWHPIKKADSAIVGSVDAKFTAWLRKQRERIKQGADITTDGKGKAATDKDGKPDAPKTGENESVASSGNDIVDEIKGATENSTQTTDGVIKQVLGNKVAKGTLSGVAIVGLVCFAKALTENADELRHDMVVLPLIRTGMQAMSLGNQIMNGMDVDMEQLGFFNKMLYDKETGSWANAKSIQAQLGEKQTGPDLPDEASVKKASEGSTFTNVVNAIPGVGAACDVLGSPVGRLFSVAISLTTPLATLAQEAVTRTGAFQDLITGAVKWMAGDAIPSFVKGPTFGNYANYGVLLGANDAAATMGAAALTPIEAGELRDFRNKDLAEQYAKKSFKDKYLNIYAADSLAARIIDRQSPYPSQNLANFAGTLFNPSKLFGSMRLQVFQPVGATEGYDYGFPKLGFSRKDMNDPQFDNPYENQRKAIDILKASGTYRNRMTDCFGVTVSDDGVLKHEYSKKLDVTSKGYKDNGCNDTAADWKRVRFYLLDTMTAAAADCYETSDKDSCEFVAMSPSGDSGTITNTRTSSKLYMVGDSLTEGMKTLGGLEDKLKASGWNTVTIQGYCGRHLQGQGDRCGSQAPAEFDGITQIDQAPDTAAIQQASTVVVALGTNDWRSTNFRASVRRMIDSIKAKNPSAKIYWVNLYSEDERKANLANFNSILKTFAESGEITIIDWASVAAQYYRDSNDKLHPYNHYPEMAQFVATPLVPVSSGIVGDIGESSDSVPCAPGTRDLGTVLSKYSGNATKTPGRVTLRLCQLSEIGGQGNNASGVEINGGAVVSSRVSGAWNELGKKAKSEGVQLSATSSFRLADSCNGTGDGSGCARPGQSLHQLGIAIDFKGQTDVKGTSTASCSGRARDPGNKYWEWLYKNAESFGFKQYTYESWHWDALNSESRCGTNQ